MIALTLALRLSPLLAMIPLLLVSNLSLWLDMLPPASTLMNSPLIPCQTSLIEMIYGTSELAPSLVGSFDIDEEQLGIVFGGSTARREGFLL
ncbi:hypothetical protein TorRG33x02_097450 [Trema orientale]|uniref:Uncharacterized protein n=1 Tax=Trema orientale TaxID=63057 RepID=A0A2P5F9N8_TREOI|nr:hypothetical protein TorRG33x02_097450 [Trema orientale]